MISRLLSRFAHTPDTTDPEIVAHHRRESVERKKSVQAHRVLSEVVTDQLFAIAERNHFGPDIETAFHLGRKE